ncbi:uncharacterized protein CEXT_109391 [Caerostris extrusa]|uniref:Uncharacterized protein n=1 Tax=Caerostris extrusa TaxID=172846 RepID=A0AAV4XA08_CAEEX|nr:uncharacterized protein CEXT_109391 [Caerostris extrusa]
MKFGKILKLEIKILTFDWLKVSIIFLNRPLGSYNGLTDVHLAHFFSRPSQQSHLKASKLITNDGTIIPEQKVKIEALQYEKKEENV